MKNISNIFQIIILQPSSSLFQLNNSIPSFVLSSGFLPLEVEPGCVSDFTPKLGVPVSEKLKPACGLLVSDWLPKVGAADGVKGKGLETAAGFVLFSAAAESVPNLTEDEPVKQLIIF